MYHWVYYWGGLGVTLIAACCFLLLQRQRGQVTAFAVAVIGLFVAYWAL